MCGALPVILHHHLPLAISQRKDAWVDPFVTVHQYQPASALQCTIRTKRPTQPLAEKFAGVTTSTSVPEVTNAHSLMSVGSPDAWVHTQAGVAPTAAPELIRAHTPLRHSQFESELANHPNKALVSKLLKGIRQGVNIGYRGPRGPTNTRNLASAHKHPEVIESELLKEVNHGRIKGPFNERPLPALRCSGLGVVPKKGNKWRMILHLSAPFKHSINDHISKDDYSLQYTSIDDAIRILSSLGPNAPMAKVDLKSAFRMIPVRPEDWELLGMYWNGQFYYDTCLPFGLRSAPYLFNQYADALAWILQNNHGLHWLIHYLDDYFLAGPPGSSSCADHLQSFLETCDKLGVPIAMDKVEGPTTTLTFLGLELNSRTKQISLPPDKLNDILTELQVWLHRRKATKRQLLSLIGKLAFAAKAIPAGRMFTRRLISLSTRTRRLHHRVRLNSQARADIQWWLTFLPSWNGTARFLDSHNTEAPDLELFTDASGTHGCGAYYNGEWFHYPWQSHQQLSPTTSIQWQELFAILAAALTWGHHWGQKRIRFHCDNEAIVLAWQNMSSKHPRLLELFRKLFLHAAQHNFTVTFQHLPGKYNRLADALSRQQFSLFFSLAPQAAKVPTPTPGVLTTF